jgi:hypothetical protein
MNFIDFLKPLIQKNPIQDINNLISLQGDSFQYYNGLFYTGGPLPFTVSEKMNVNIKTLVNSKTDETTKAEIKGNKLIIKTGNCTSKLPINNDAYCMQSGEGVNFDLTFDLLSILKKLLPLTGNNDIRTFCNGILWKKGIFHTLNGIIATQFFCGKEDNLNLVLPNPLINLLIKLKSIPQKMQYDISSITFYFENGFWVRSPLIQEIDKWPDFEQLFNIQHNSSEEFPSKFFDALKTLKNLDYKFFIKEHELKVSTETGEEVSHIMEGLNSEGCFNTEQFLLLKNIIKYIDLSLYPKPCIFYGDNLRGCIIGIKI